MSEVGNAPTSPGLVSGIVSCVCAVFGFFVPVLGMVLAIIGLVAGLQAYGKGKAAGYRPGLILGLIGALVSGLCLVVAALAILALVGMIGGAGMMMSAL